MQLEDLIASKESRTQEELAGKLEMNTELATLYRSFGRDERL
ncbi:hypothetical protein [Fulvivirga marina]|nr:hypothetical protein [Fulvivirga marina]